MRAQVPLYATYGAVGWGGGRHPPPPTGAVRSSRVGMAPDVGATGEPALRWRQRRTPGHWRHHRRWAQAPQRLHCRRPPPRGGAAA